MTDNYFVEEAEKINDPAEILNWYRNLYHAENSNTERGIIARAINDILPEYSRQKAEIERMKTTFEIVKQGYDDMFSANRNLMAEVERLNNTIEDMCDREITLVERSEKYAKSEAYKEFAEILKEKLKPTLTALFCIGEILVDVSKSHISPDKAIEKIREQLTKCGVIHSRFQFEEMIDDTYKKLTEENK